MDAVNNCESCGQYNSESCIMHLDQIIYCKVQLLYFFLEKKDQFLINAVLKITVENVLKRVPWTKKAPVQLWIFNFIAFW